MQDHVEALARAFGVFSGAFIATRWAAKSTPVYDVWLVLFAACMGVLLGK